MTVALPPTEAEAAAVSKSLRDWGASDWLVSEVLGDLGYVPPPEPEYRGVYQFLPSTTIIDLP